MQTSAAEPMKAVYVLSDFDGCKYKLVMKGNLNLLGTKKIKKYLEKTSGVPISEQCITLNGTEIGDHLSGDEIGLYDGIVLILQKRGGQSVPSHSLPNRTPNSKSYDKMVSLSPAVGSMPQQMNRSADSKTLRMTNLLKSPPEGYHPIQDTCVNTYPSNHHSCRPQPSPSHTRGLSASGSSAHSDDSPILQSPATQSLGAPSQARDSSPYSGDGYVLQLEKENKLLKDENAVLRAHLKNAERRFCTSQAQSEKEMQTLRDAVEKVKTEFEEQKMFQEEKWILKEEEYARELDLLREQRQTLKKEQEQFEREQHTLVQDLEVQLSNYQRELENKNAEIMGLETDIEQLRQNPVLCRVNGDNIDELAQLSLAEVAKTFNVGELAIDPANNTCVVDVEEYGVPLLFTVDKVTGRLYMYVTLLDFIPANTTVRCRLFETLLQASLLGKDTAGGGVGVCMSSEIILMSTSIDLRHTSPSAMAAMAIPFVQSAASWLPIVEDIASTTG